MSLATENSDFNSRRRSRRVREEQGEMTIVKRRRATEDSEREGCIFHPDTAGGPFILERREKNNPVLI